MTKILYIEGSLEAWSEKSSKGGNKGCEAGEDEKVELVWNIGNGLDALASLQRNQNRFWKHRKVPDQGAQKCRKRGPEIKSFRYKYWVWCAMRGTPGTDTQVVHGTDHVVKTHEVRSPKHSENDSANKCTNKAFHGLLRRQLDERRASNSHSPNVCKNVIAYNQRGRNPKPDKSFQYIIDDEMAGERLAVDLLYFMRRT